MGMRNQFLTLPLPCHRYWCSVSLLEGCLSISQRCPLGADFCTPPQDPASQYATCRLYNFAARLVLCSFQGIWHFAAVILRCHFVAETCAYSGIFLLVKFSCGIVVN